MIGEIGISWISNKCMDGICRLILKKDNTNLLEIFIDAINDAARKAFNICVQNEWDDKGFKLFLREYIEEKAIIPIFLDDINITKALFSSYFDDEQQQYVTIDLISEFESLCLNEFAQNVNITNYLLLHELKGRRDEEEKIRNEHDKLFVLIREDIEQSRQTDKYHNLDILNRILYPFICSQLTKGCSNQLLETAYFLADVYDYTSEYEKSMVLAGLIKEVIDPKYTRLSTHHLRQLIGCIYSFIIPKIDNLDEKERMLAQAECDMEIVKEYINEWEFETNIEKYFIDGLFASNYGALLTNKADCEKKKGNKEQELIFLELALEYQYKGKEARATLLSNYVSPLESSFYDDIERYLYKSRSNIAGILYRLGKYDDALLEHGKILDYYLEKGQDTNAYITKSYMIGCYLGKMEMGTLLDEERKMCLQYTEECKTFYRKNQDYMRMKDIDDKERKIKLYTK